MPALQRAGRVGSAGLIGLAVVFSCFTCGGALAQEDPLPSVRDYTNDQTDMSRDEWRQRVEQARRRAKELARERREHPELYAPIPEDPEQVASERVLNDDSLQIGDIVATKNGMFVFRGRPGQSRSVRDFVPLSPK